MNSKRKALAGVALGLGSVLISGALARRQRTIELAGRGVLITGGSRGLGLELARQCVDAGANVAICARNRSNLQEARRILRQRAKRGGHKIKIIALPCDVTQRREVEKTIRRAHQSLGTLDMLINNAGIIQVGPESVMSLQEHEEAINTHYWGPLYTIEAVLPLMRAQGFGRIVNVASVGGKVSIPHLLPYSASKHALVGLSEGYRAELLKENIYVTTVCPGLIRTGSPKNAIFKGRHRQEQTWFTVSDSLPGASLNARETAEAIIEAGRQGRGTVVLSTPAKLLAALNGLAPAFVSEVSGLVNRWLPSAGGIGTNRATGEESQSRWSPSFLTKLTERAARRNNQ